MVNEEIKNLLVIADNENIDTGVNHYNFRGIDCDSFSLQLKTANVTVRILCSNIQKPGASGWTDITSSLTTFTGNDFIVIQDIKALWWQIRYERTAANNYIRAYLLKY